MLLALWARRAFGDASVAELKLQHHMHDGWGPATMHARPSAVQGGLMHADNEFINGDRQ